MLLLVFLHSLPTLLTILVGFVYSKYVIRSRLRKDDEACRSVGSLEEESSSRKDSSDEAKADGRQSQEVIAGRQLFRVRSDERRSVQSDPGLGPLKRAPIRQRTRVLTRPTIRVRRTRTEVSSSEEDNQTSGTRQRTSQRRRRSRKQLESDPVGALEIVKPKQFNPTLSEDLQQEASAPSKEASVVKQHSTGTQSLDTKSPAPEESKESHLRHLSSLADSSGLDNEVESTSEVHSADCEQSVSAVRPNAFIFPEGDSQEHSISAPVSHQAPNVHDDEGSAVAGLRDVSDPSVASLEGSSSQKSMSSSTSGDVVADVVPRVPESFPYIPVVVKSKKKQATANSDHQYVNVPAVSDRPYVNVPAVKPTSTLEATSPANKTSITSGQSVQDVHPLYSSLDWHSTDDTSSHSDELHASSDSGYEKISDPSKHSYVSIRRSSETVFRATQATQAPSQKAMTLPSGKQK